MLRIRDVNLLNKLQDKYRLSPCNSVNEFINVILKQYAFKDTKEERERRRKRQRDFEM